MLTKELENKINESLQQFSCPGLLGGDMGVCIYFFVLGRMTANSQLTFQGETALKNILVSMNQNKKLYLEDGVSGIAMGLSFLFKHKFVEGDVNDALEHIDDHIYRGLCTVLEEVDSSKIQSLVLELLFYYVVRYQDECSKVRKLLYERVIVHLFNYIYIHRKDDFYQESLPFCLKKESYLFIGMLVWIFRLGIEKKRITYIFNEMKYFLFSSFPILGANRLYLMTVARCVGKFIQDKDWLAFAEKLSATIDLRYILEEELKDKNVLPETGVAGIFLLRELNLRMGFFLSDDNYNYKKRMEASTLWDRMASDVEFFSSYYSLNGYCGIKILLNYLEGKTI